MQPASWMGGFRNLTFDPHPSSWASQQLLGNWEDAYNAFLKPYQDAYGNSSFSDFLTGQGRNYFGGLFEQQRSNELASGTTPDHVTSALDFLRGLHPLDRYMGLTPRDRGENPAMQSPFTRYIGRF